MMDRLTERDESPCMCCDGIDSCRVSCGKKKIYDKLQHYEDLEEAGRLVELPCAVGDTVYCIYNGKVIQGTVRLIRPFISKERIIFKGNIICEVDDIFFNDGRKEEIKLFVVFINPYGIERVAYLTKEEAEAALKERESE